MLVHELPNVLRTQGAPRGRTRGRGNRGEVTLAVDRLEYGVQQRSELENLPVRSAHEEGRLAVPGSEGTTENLHAVRPGEDVTPCCRGRDALPHGPLSAHGLLLG